jgi:hypothetical protein
VRKLTSLRVVHDLNVMSTWENWHAMGGEHALSLLRMSREQEGIRKP